MSAAKMKIAAAKMKIAAAAMIAAMVVEKVAVKFAFGLS